MDANRRREQILEILQTANAPVSAGTLAENFTVSRQIIVGDIALLRASGTSIIATARGYVLQALNSDELNATASNSYVIACQHDNKLLAAELYCIVDNGGCITTTSVEHSVYGTITIPLEIKSRYDADAYLNKMQEDSAELLACLTRGIHLHTLTCPDAEAYRRILVELREKGILYFK